MAVLGSGGRLELRREAASPCVILPESINYTSNSLAIECDGYWNGDHVVISNPEGLPIFIDGRPQKWDSVATYEQSTLFVAENRDHIARTTTQDFYKRSGNPNNDYFRGDSAYENDDALFYYQGQDGDDEQVTQIDGYICVDSLGRIKLYETRCQGLACCGNSLLDFGSVPGGLDFDFIVINHFGTTEYQNGVIACFGEIGEYLYNDVAEDDGVSDPDLLVNSICNDPPLYINPVAGTPEFDNADVQPRGNINEGPHPLWVILCDVREWSLELDAPSVDTTGVGEKFGEAVKSLVTGGGSADFFIDRQCFENDYNDNGLYLMQLLLMTQMDGCKAHAKFFMIDRGSDQCRGTNCGDLAGALWYETDILVTRNAINLRPTDLVAGTANFVTTGEIKLQQGEVLNP